MIATTREMAEELLRLGLPVETSDMIEEWRDIEGYEWLYQISSFGRVKSLRGKVERILKLGTTKKGYKSVGLQVNGNHKTRVVHRLVAKAFIPNPNSYPCVNHKDESKDNNHVSNLEWCTVLYNNTYGTVRERQSLSSPKDRVVCVYDLNGNFEREFHSVREAARFYNAKHSVICHCCTGSSKNQRHITFRDKLWCFRGEEETIPQKLAALAANRHHYKVTVYHDNGHVDIFRSATEAGKALKLSRNRFCTNGRYEKRGIRWTIN